MGKIVKDIVENTFTKKNTNTYELSILVGMGSFDYVIMDSQQKLLALKSYHLSEEASVEEMEHLLGLDPLPRNRYRNVRIAWASGKSTLIPRRLFHSLEKKAFLEQSATVRDSENVRHDELTAAGMMNIFAIPQELETYLNNTFPGHRMSHLGSALIEGQRKLSVQHQGQHVYVHFIGKQAFLCVYQHLNLLFYNSFSYQSAKDFIYYLLLIFKQFNLSQEETPVFISGQLVEDSEIYRHLQRYVRQYHFQQPPAFLSYGPKMEEQPKYLYFGVLALSITA